MPIACNKRICRNSSSIDNSDKAMAQLTPFLRMFLQFFGNLSIQLKPFSPCQPGSLLSLLWNLLLTCLVLRQIAQFNYEINGHLQGDDSPFWRSMREKPFFALFVSFNTRYLLVTTVTLNTLYFTFNSYRSSPLISLLDTFQHDTLTCPVKSRGLFTRSLLLYNGIACLALLREVLYECRTDKFWPLSVLTIAICYVLMSHRCMPLLLAHYQQYAVSLEIESITSHFKMTRNIDLTKHRLSQLARLSSQLNRLMSFPRLLMVLSYLTETIYSLSFFWTSRFQSLNAYLLPPLVTVLYLTVVESQIDHQLNALATLLIDEQENRRKCAKLQQLGTTRMSCASDVVPLYQAELHLPVFSLFTINHISVFSVILCSVHYCVLITQTST